MAAVKPWSLLSDRLFWAAILFCAATLGTAVWGLFGRSKPAAPVTKSKYTHLHCPSCGAEYPYTPALEGQLCTDCEAESQLVPTVGSVRLRGSEAAWLTGKIVVLAVVAGVLVPLMILFSASRLRALRRAAEERLHQRLVWNCPFCQGKISYPISKVGSGVLCSRCKTAFTLAAPEPE